MQTNEIVIIGGLGKTGGRVFDGLQARGENVRAASRSTAPAFDWAGRQTWAPALAGATIAYVTYQPDLAVPRAADDLAVFAATAREAGVQRIVLLSGRGEDGAVLSEGRIIESGIDFTVLRASWFDQNFSEGVFLDGMMAGELALPVADIGELFVSVDDIADAAVTVMTEPGHNGRIYELTGPRLLTFAEAVAEIAAASGQVIRFVQVPFDTFQVELEAAGLPGEVIWLMEELFTRTFDGGNEKVMDGVRQILGHEATDFSDYAREAAATGIWSK